MAVNIMTAEDLEAFKVEFFSQFEKMVSELKDLVNEHQKNKALEHQGKRWLKSHQVQKMLGISPGTLQTLRINRTIPFSKIGGVIFYSYEDIILTMEKNRRSYTM